MSQTFTDDCFAGTHVGQTDLQNMENNFAALKSCFSGTGAPSNIVPGMLWFDTDDYVMKTRNAGDSAWLGLMHGDSNQKIWIYRNSAMDGWVVDSSVTDKVLALKGGSTYTTGAATAGTWTQPNHTHGMTHTHSHNHQWYNETDADNNDQTYNSGGNAVTLSEGANKSTFGIVYYMIDRTSSYGGGDTNNLSDSYTDNDASASSASSTDGDATANTYRPAAAVGTLQYLDV